MNIEENLPILMFAVLALFLFSGYPVAFVLGGIGLAFAFIGIAFDVFSLAQFGAIPSRIFGGLAENLILTAIPMFILMGTVLEKSGVAKDLLNSMQVILRNVPGGLALSVTFMGTIMAATTGIIGASVVMMTLLALPVMIERKYNTPLATGAIAASGTLGILIPPSIMLVIMADLLAKSVGNMFVAALFPGLILSGLYATYIIILCFFRPELAPKPKSDFGPENITQYIIMICKSFIPPIILICIVLGSILAGLATPTEAAGVGAAGAVILTFINLYILPKCGISDFNIKNDIQNNNKNKKFTNVMKEAVQNAALTNAMLFAIFVGATIFSFVFRALGGDDIVIAIVEALGLDAWGLLILIMGIVFILGFFFDWIEITLIIIPIFSPVIEQMDFGNHVDRFEMIYWFAILMAVNLQTSFLTPPFGFALFYMKAVAPKNVRMEQIYLGIIPFVILQLICLILIMIFPEIALWLPRQILN